MRKLKHYKDQLIPCKECPTYPICQNAYVLYAVGNCYDLSVDLENKKIGLRVSLSSAKTKARYILYLYDKTNYLGCFYRTENQYYGFDPV